MTEMQILNDAMYTPFTRGIPIDCLYEDSEIQEIYDRLFYTAQKSNLCHPRC